MTESVIFSGMVEALVCILLFSVELLGAVANPIGYDAILIPGDIIGGLHQVGDSYDKFERRLIINHNHPHNQYSNTKIIWPEEKSPHTINARITSFKCINKTPNNARALMNVIRGGMGRPELVVDVIYTPLRFMIINTMIITCDIYYTEDSRIVHPEERVLSNALDTIKCTTSESEIESSKVHEMPRIALTNSSGGLRLETTSSVDSYSTTESMIDSQTTFQGTSIIPGKIITESIRNVDSTTQRTTETIINGERLLEVENATPWIKSTGFRDGDTSAGADKATTPEAKTDQETVTKLVTVQRARQKLNETISSTTSPGLYLSSQESQREGSNSRIISDTEKTSQSVTFGTTLAVSSAKSIEPSSQEGTASTVPWYDMILQKKNNESLHGDQRNPNTSRKDYENVGMKTTTLAARISVQRIENSTLKVTSVKTLGETFATTPMVDITSAYSEEDSNPENGSEVELRCRIKNLRMNKTNANTNARSKDFKERQNAASKERKTVDKPTSSPAYKLRVKIMPTDSKRKISLAKITYA